jgi:hypothetical protein
VAIDPGAPLSSVACPSVTLCAAVDVAGGEVTFNPQAPAGAASASIDAGQTLVAVSCPSSSQCGAIDAAMPPARNPAQLTFNPGPPPTPIQSQQGFTQSSLVALSCPSTSICIDVDSGGRAGTFGTGSQSSFPIDGSISLSGLTCLSASQCIAVDVKGNQVTFDPGPSGAVAAPAAVDPGTTPTGVSCPSAAQCTAVDVNGQEVTFDPQTRTAEAPVAIDGTTTLTGLACPASNQCTASDLTGAEVTFDPSVPAPAGASLVDPGGNPVYGIACPSTARCIEVDGRGREVTFDPQSPGTPSPVEVDAGHALLAVACPSISQCTAVDDRGAEVSFDPGAPGTPLAIPMDPGHGLPAVACPASVQCTAVDDSGAEITFSPQAPAFVKASAIDTAPAVAVACPLPTQCTAVDALGRQATFDPQAPANTALSTVDAGSQLNALACRTPYDCVAVDAAGHAVEGNPHGTGPWSPSSLAGGPLVGVACPSPLECVAVDPPGDAFVGSSGALPPVPGSLSGPAIRGQARQGRRLTERHGGWSNAPTSYRYQWERCNSAARRCAPILGATAPAYTPAAADVGHRLRVQEWAADIAGEGAGAVSAATKLVQPVVPVAASRVAISGVARRRPKLSFTLTAGPREPPVRTIAVTLPSVLRLAVARGHRVSAAVVLTVRGRARRFSRRVHGRTLTITLAKPAARVRVTIVAPAITVSSAVAKHARRHKFAPVRVLLVTRGARGVRARLAVRVPVA